MKIGRNQPCPCGSGKKYKKCCLGKEGDPAANVDQSQFGRHILRRTEESMIQRLLDYAADEFGEELFQEGWADFMIWGEYEVEEDLLQEFEAVFAPWLVFDWDIADFLEDPYPEGDEAMPELPLKTIAMLYAEEQEDTLDSYQKRYLEAVSRAPYSYYQVVGVAPGQSLTLKNLLIPETVTVSESQAATEEVKGCILLTKVVCLDGVCVMVGAFPVPVPPEYHSFLIDLRGHISDAHGGLTQERLREYELELRRLLFSIIEKTGDSHTPQVSNTDGEPLVPTKLLYELKCSPAEAFHCLKSLAAGEKESDILAGAAYDRSGELASVQFSWLKKGNARNAGMPNTVMGNLTIEKDRLTVEVNSENRSRIIQDEIQSRLNNKAVYKNSVLTSVEKMLEGKSAGEGGAEFEKNARAQEELMQIPEIRQQISEMAQKHWEDWVDTPIPMLDDMTPRQAAKDPVGREKLEGLFLHYEAMQKNQPGNPFHVDIEQLKKMVGYQE
jgi:hypothetical protein